MLENDIIATVIRDFNLKIQLQIQKDGIILHKLLRKVKFVESTLQKRSFKYKLTRLERNQFRPLRDSISFLDLFQICEFLDQISCIFVA